jgi:pimeloyl-ACP methyl ester carboxylesterase
MKRFVVKFLLVILLFVGLVYPGYAARFGLLPVADRPTSTSACSIATRSTPLQGGTLSYDSVGQGPTILLLHGLFASKEQWDGISCRLAAAGYRAIAPDLPGYGASQGFAIGTYALEHQVSLLHEFTQQLGIQTLSVAGSSMGGSIAALYTQQYPQQVCSLAFIGSPSGIVGWADPIRTAILQGINPFIPITTDQFDLEISLLFVKPPQIPNSIKEQKVKDYIDRNRHYQQVWDIVNLYDDVTCKAQLRSVPTLALWGEKDSIYSIRGADRLQQCHRYSTVRQLPNAGHLLLMENADTAATIYLRFLARVSTPTHV